MAQHEIIVGNIGTVYTGPSWKYASTTYKDYMWASKEGAGSVAGESVTWMKDDEVYKEYIGTQNND
jgi:hypothetical protein